MTIKSFQTLVKDEINTLASLREGGALGLIEDDLALVDKIRAQLLSGVAVVVTTPTYTRDGIPSAGISAGGELVIQCMEQRAHLRNKPGAITAIDAAEAIMFKLDGFMSLHFKDIKSSVDRDTGILTVSVTFSFSVVLGQ